MYEAIEHWNEYNKNNKNKLSFYNTPHSYPTYILNIK